MHVANGPNCVLLVTSYGRNAQVRILSLNVRMKQAGEQNLGPCVGVGSSSLGILPSENLSPILA